MADCDLEDGEILDSDNEESFKSVTQSEGRDCLLMNQKESRSTNPSLYRDRTSGLVSSSNSDDDDDEEEKFLWKRKRLKYAASREQSDSRDSSSRFGWGEQGNGEGNWSSVNKGFAFANRDILKPKRQKNIWGAVLQEQTLSQGFIGFDMEHKSKKLNDRSVEAYSFKMANQDPRPWRDLDSNPNETETGNGEIFSDAPDLEKLEENFVGSKAKGIKRKFPVKDRLGTRQYNKRKSRDHYKVTASDSPTLVAEAVADKLQEPKVDLIMRVVRTMGRKKTLELAYITEDIEDSGGMLTNDGSRRRTPGGVFFQMLKTDSSFTKDKMKAVFGDEMKKEAKRKKKLRSRRLKLSLQKTNPIPVDDKDGMETEGAVDISQSEEKTTLERSSCPNENCQESSDESTDASDGPDPTQMDLTELLKHHVEQRRIEVEQEKKKAALAQKDMNMENENVEILAKQAEPDENAVAADIYLDDESEMTFDL